jgi:hypothetical protein
MICRVTAVLFDDVVETDYGQFDLIWTDDFGFDGDDTRFFAGQINGLVGAASGNGIYLHFARQSGGSPLKIVLAQTEPESLHEWEDVVEVSITVPTDAEPTWNTWAGERRGPLDLPSGSYRVRVSARGRDAGSVGELADGAVDFYLVEFWPAPALPDAIVRTGSADAEYWHNAFGHRR